MNVSVVVPTFNRATVLPRAIESVLAQQWPSLELIVVDDGSSDQTIELLNRDYVNKHAELRVISQANSGVSAARNAAIKQAKGEWIALLDSDDEWLPNKLQQQCDALQTSGLQVCHTQELWIRNGVRVNQMNKHQKSGGRIFNACLPLCAMSPSSIVIHRSVFDRVGLFNEALPACEDYDLWLRIAALYEVAYVEQPCIRKYGGHEDQLSRQFWGMDRFRVIALDALLTESCYAQALSTDEYDAALSMLLKKLKILLKGAQKHDNHALIKDCQARLARWGSTVC